MRSLLYVALLAPGLAWAQTQTSPIEAWYGAYGYSASYGKTAGGSAVERK